MENLGVRIKSARERASLTQEALGEIVGVKKSTICNYERGIRIPELCDLSAIADACNVTTDYLLGRGS